MLSGAACCGRDRTIVEATAGNTGVGLALIGVNRGYKVMLYVPEQFAEEKCKLMRGLGATVIRTPEAEGMAGAIRRALQFERRRRVRSLRCSLRIRRIRIFMSRRLRWRCGSRWMGAWMRGSPGWDRRGRLRVSHGF